MPNNVYDWSPKADYFRYVPTLAGDKDAVSRYVFKHPEIITGLSKISESVNQLKSNITLEGEPTELPEALRQRIQGKIGSAARITSGEIEELQTELTQTGSLKIQDKATSEQIIAASERINDRLWILERVKENLEYIKSQIPPNKDDILFWVDKQKAAGENEADIVKKLNEQINEIAKQRGKITQKIYDLANLLPEEIKELDAIEILGKVNIKLFSRIQIIKALKNYEIAGYFVLGELQWQTKA